jgi:hypothetical protein
MIVQKVISVIHHNDVIRYQPITLTETQVLQILANLATYYPTAKTVIYNSDNQTFYYGEEKIVVAGLPVG